LDISIGDANLAARDAATTVEFLCTDLDGSILLVDSFWESLLALVGKHFWYVFLIPFWSLRGKAALKHEIARRAALNAAHLPFRTELISFLRQEKSRGAKIILATGADATIGAAVADHLGLFDHVVASDGVTNLTGAKKKEAIRQYIGGKPFDYVGDSWKDIPVWKAANHAILVEPSESLSRSVKKIDPHCVVFERRGEGRAPLWKSLRPHHWVKNLLVFVPIVMAHDINQLPKLWHVLAAFASFSLCASGVYILNDLLDLEADRLHPEKKSRPFASGDVPVLTGLSVAPLLFLAGFVIAAKYCPIRFVEIIFIYVVATSVYSIYGKRVPVVDVLLLTALYLLRILGGGVAAEVPVSPWLLAFSMFFMLSLAFTKRHAELTNQEMNGGDQTVISKRDYQAGDRGLVQQFGVTSGYLSVLVLALYINGREVTALYRHPQWIWLACPMLLFWISRVWFLANRGKLHEDPVVFAAMDPVSYALGGLLLLLLFAAA
jgi:4-hydroxybenzoate polyprenyltransferase/phosphoglycolate phosphatase-like HAD superfamily hydrolase